MALDAFGPVGDHRLYQVEGEPNTPSVTSARVVLPSANAPLFSPLELSVIRLGQQDATALLPKPGLLNWLFYGLLFKPSPSNPLGDERLEALRSLVVALRRSGPPPVIELRLAAAAGLTTGQIDYLKSHIE